MNKEKPLSGKVVLTTRARKQSSELAKALEKLGAEVVEFPTIKIEPPDSYEELDKAIGKLDARSQMPEARTYDWIVFTSANGVIYFLERLKTLGKRVEVLKGTKLAAIGPATAKKLEEAGLAIDYIPEEYRAEELVEGLKEKGIKGKRILIPRAKKAREVLPKGLRNLRATVDVVPVYQTLLDDSFAEQVKRMLKLKKVDVITFTSSSTVKNFVSLLKGIDLAKLLDKVKIACIGPITADTARKFGLKVDFVACEYTVEGLVETVIEAVEEEKARGRD